METNMTMQEYIGAKIELNKHKQNYRVGMDLGISSGMLSHYRTGYTKQPALAVAREVYRRDQVIIWPYSEAAVRSSDED